MRTQAEREKVINQCIIQMMQHRNYMSVADKYHDMEMMSTIKRNIVAAHQPLLQMFAEELQEAMNPITNASAPAQIVALKIFAQAIERQYPQAKEVADALMDSVKFKFDVIPGEVRKSEKG